MFAPSPLPCCQLCLESGCAACKPACVYPVWCGNLAASGVWPSCLPHHRMDDISFQFAWMYYAALSKGAEGLRRLGGLYSTTSVRWVPHTCSMVERSRAGTRTPWPPGLAQAWSDHTNCRASAVCLHSLWHTKGRRALGVRPSWRATAPQPRCMPAWAAQHGGSGVSTASRSAWCGATGQQMASCNCMQTSCLRGAKLLMCFD